MNQSAATLELRSAPAAESASNPDAAPRGPSLDSAAPRAASSPGGDKPEAIPAEVPSLLNDAMSLIVYLAGTGDTPRAEIISAVLEAGRAVDRNHWTLNVNNAFFAAFGELSKLARPVTARSLADSESRTVRFAFGRWSVMVAVLLPILVLLSSLSYVNSQFAANAENLVKYSYQIESPKLAYLTFEEFSSKPNVDKPAIEPSAPTAEALDARKAGDIETHNDLLRQSIAQIYANGQMLRRLTQYEQYIDLNGGLNLMNQAKLAPPEPASLQTPDVADALKTEGELANRLRTVRVALNIVLSVDKTIYGVLSTYILPLLCAMLGAAAFGLRSLSEKTIARTYRVSYSFYARTVLAVIAGFAVGLFSDFTAKLSLQPLASAFVAGYAVEAFFIFLDTLLQAIQKPQA